MASTGLNTFYSILGWSLLPDYATNTLLRTFVTPVLGFQPTPAVRRITYAVVVLTYLIYGFIDATRSMPPSFYDFLGVPVDVDESGLKSAFRAFAKRNHPDRVGEEGTALFMAVRAGYEALMDPARRWAYDRYVFIFVHKLQSYGPLRFGPELLFDCQHCVTHREYLNRGLIHSLGFHIGSGLFLFFFTIVGQKSSVSFVSYFRDHTT